MPPGIYQRTKPPWNKGKVLPSLSKEQKDKISSSLMGKKKTESHARHIGDAKRGIPRTKECIEKIKRTSKGKRRSPDTEFKKGLIPWNKGMIGLWSGEKNSNWKGGKSKDSYGYVLLKDLEHPHSHNGYVREHRIIVENIIHRILAPWEEVHHIDKIKNHNSPGNLIAFTSKKWHVIFEQGNPVPCEKIVFDGREYALPSM